MKCTVIAPKGGRGVNVVLANGKHISAAPGQRVEYDLTGDEVGAVLGHVADLLCGPEELVVDAEAFIAEKRAQHGDAAGGVLCTEREGPIVKGSKKWLRLNPPTDEPPAPAAAPVTGRGRKQQ